MLEKAEARGIVERKTWTKVIWQLTCEICSLPSIDWKKISLTAGTYLDDTWCVYLVTLPQIGFLGHEKGYPYLQVKTRLYFGSRFWTINFVDFVNNVKVMQHLSEIETKKLCQLFNIRLEMKNLIFVCFLAGLIFSMK